MIEIIASSCPYRSPQNVIHYESNDFWQSENTEGHWIEFNFNFWKLKVRGYSLKTYGKGYDKHHIKNWVLDGSNDKSTGVNHQNANYTTLKNVEFYGDVFIKL